MAEVRHADAAARRRALVLLGGAAAAGGLIIAAQSWLREPVRAWLLDDPAATVTRARLILAGAGALLIAPLIVFAVYAWRLGAQTIATREFPPPGRAVIRDTAVITGDAALAHGRGLQALSVLLVVAAAAIGAMFWWLGALPLTRGALS
jgi:hypothetical protein